MKKYQALGYGKFKNKMFYAEAETAREAWDKIWLEAKRQWYSVPFGNVIEMS